MSSHRIERVQEEIKKEVSQIIHQELKDPRIGFTTITEVEMSKDLSFAKIFISVMGSEEVQKSTLEGLEHGKGFIRSEIGKRIRLRHTPEIAFVLDRSLEHGAKIQQIINKLKGQEENQAKNGE